MTNGARARARPHPGSVPRMADALDEARARLFVGRDRELDRIAQMVDHGARAHAHVHGPGGMGKTELLRAVARVARRRGLETVELDARHRTPADLRAAAWPRGDGGAALHLARSPGGDAAAFSSSVWLVDCVEGSDAATVACEAPHGAVLVTAGREPLEGAAASIALGPLAPADSMRYLERAGVPAEHRRPIAEACAGHPLALTIYALVARQRGGDPAIGHHPEMVQVLLRQLLRDLPGEQERTILRVAALVPRMGRDLLECLEPRHASELWGWLARLPFVERRGAHVSLHDVVREALLADLGWRDPSALHALQRRIARCYLSAPRLATDADRADLLELAGVACDSLSADEIAERLERLAADPATHAPPPPPLDRPTFAREIKRALQRYDRLDLLAQSPLVGCRAVVERAEKRSLEDPALALQDLLRESCEAVRDEHGDPRGWQVLERTYLRPAVKQLAAAHELGLSFGTYRRALTEATARVVDRLWRLEVGGS